LRFGLVCRLKRYASQPENRLVLDRLVLGTSEAELLRSYPTLHAEDLTNAWAYFRSHREEIDRQIRENEEA